MTPAIEVRGLSKQYGTVSALRSVSLAVERGTVTALLGPNGAGKTTLMEIIMGMRRSTDGIVRVLECDPWEDSDASWRTRTGYLPQEVVVIEYLTGVEYIELLTELYGRRASEVRQRLPEALEFFDLTEAKDKRLGAYSTGMKKKIVLCALYLCRPEILILDEPFEGLDPHAIRRLQGWIAEMANGGMTFLLSSHAIPFVEKLAQRIAVIDQGEIRYAGEVSGAGSLLSGDKQYASVEDLYFSLVRRQDHD
ncbi:MAG TPA: ABC transporter ATP-binding protein [Gemmatimonadaceae bacterium]